MKPRLIDSHCHIHFAAYAEGADAVACRALERGIWLITVGTNRETSEQAVAFAEKYPEGVYAVIGLHPEHTYDTYHDTEELRAAPQTESFDAAFYHELAKSKKVVGVGECGLDFYRLPDDPALAEEIKKIQRENFLAQIEFAREHSLPLVCHVREAADEAAAIFKKEAEERGPVRGVMHCFTGTVDEAGKYLALGLHISFTGIVTFPPKKSETENPLAAVARSVPLNRVLVETDAPYLAPVPLRGSRNEPQNVELVAERLAQVYGVESSVFFEESTKNAVELFGLVTRD